jgi:predicted HicB family RNase H-like nuclease
MTNNTMTIDGVTAVIAYDPDINQFRGKFLGLNGGADFYADDITGLKREGALSLKVFREACAEDGVEPLRNYSGRFVVRADPEIHAAAVQVAAAQGKSLNQFVVEAVQHAVR